MNGDLLIIGAGPAGLGAAEIALAHGLRVTLVDQQPAAGGNLWRQGVAAPWPRSRQRRFGPVLANPALRYLANHRLALWLSPHQALLEGPEGPVQVSADRLLLAAGARELVPPFPGWTLPGVTGAGALQAMTKTGVALDSEQISLVGSGPLLLASAATLSATGARLSGIFEAQPRQHLRRLALGLLASPRLLWQALQLRRQCALTRYECGWRLLRAEGVQRLEAVQLADPRGRQQRIRCTRLGVSYGLVPNIECAAGLKLTERNDRGFPALQVDRQQRCSQPQIYAAGEITGVGGGALAELEGQIAALAMVGDEDRLRRCQRRRDALQRDAQRLADSFHCPAALLPEPDRQTLLCRCEDVPWSVVLDTPAADWRTLKLASRLGMGACQGRTCGAILQAYAYPLRRDMRPPISPVSAATLATLTSTSEQGPCT